MQGMASLSACDFFFNYKDFFLKAELSDDLFARQNFHTQCALRLLLTTWILVLLNGLRNTNPTNLLVLARDGY